MNYKTGLISLGTTVAIALLLPIQARANDFTPTENTASQPATLTSVEPLPKVLTDVVLQAASEAVEPGAIAANSTQQTDSSDPVAIEIANAGVDTSLDANVDINVNQSENAPDDSLLLPSSTSSSDLQLIEAPLATESGVQTPLAQPLNIAQTTSGSSQSERWHFLLVPYIYIPFSISGSATFRGTEEFRNSFARNFDDVSRDFEFTPDEIRTSLRNSLNFAFLGALEAWTPNYTVGILTNVDYASLSSEETIERSVRRPGFADFVPTELNADLDTQLWNVDLAASYRFYDLSEVNPEGVDSEFDLGPLVFDVLGGVSLLSINTQLGLSTNLGGEGEFSSSRTLISPLLGARLRWNTSREFAVLLSGAVSGFGIDGVTRFSVQGGINWMFSGNTSLGVGYRFAFLDYNSDEVDLNVDQNGPYVNIGFRF